MKLKTAALILALGIAVFPAVTSAASNHSVANTVKPSPIRSLFSHLHGHSHKTH